MSSTRFQGRNGISGPMPGALQCFPVVFDDVANNETVSARIKLPAGMAYEITEINVSADAVTSDPSLTIGTSAAGTQIVAAVNITTNLGTLTIKEGTVAAGGFIDIVAVADAGDAAESVSICVWGYPTSEPTSENKR